MSSFFQTGPSLGNQWDGDEILQRKLKRYLPQDVFKKVAPHLKQVGEDAATSLFAWSQNAEDYPPRLINYEPWGRRKDNITISEGWRNIEAYAATNGIVASGYERQHGPASRLYQCALLYLFHPSSAFVSCPLAMTDGAAKLIETYGNDELKRRAFAHLTSRDPKTFWTSGQWMTEKIGGSDVALTETTAKRNSDQSYSLSGVKYFTSATNSQMAMTLARPEGAEPGSRGLSLFYLETRLPNGELNGIEILRLKDKLGTRAMPTAELELHGTRAFLVGDEGNGVKKISTLFNVTRIYNSICSVAQMRRAVALAGDYARKRYAFGRSVSEHSLFRESIAPHLVELEGCVEFILSVTQLLGKEDLKVATPNESALLRLLTPLVKLYTGKQSLNTVSEMVEVFAGAGYCEDTGIPRLLRDAQVFSIWEGTTNVLSLDLLRALRKECPFEVFVSTVQAEIKTCENSPAKSRFLEQLEHLSKFFKENFADQESTSASARSLAFFMARIYVGSLLLSSAQESKSARETLVAKRWIDATNDLVLATKDYRAETDEIFGSVL